MRFRMLTHRTMLRDLLKLIFSHYCGSSGFFIQVLQQEFELKLVSIYKDQEVIIEGMSFPGYQE